MNLKNILLIVLIYCVSISSCLHTKQRKSRETIIVSANTRACNEGMLSKQCMLVKHKATQKEWENFYDEIDGFAFEKGFEYELLIQKSKIANPPADGSNLKYKLVRIIRATKMEVDMPLINEINNSSKGLPLGKSQWIIEHFNNPQKEPSTKNCQITLNEELSAFYGNDGCNSIRGEVKVQGNQITFSKIMGTRMACENMNESNLFLKKLEETNRFEIKGGELFLYFENKLLMTLESFR